MRSRPRWPLYFKEAVAVVTNPAIDREREVEHFSTETIVGSRPPLMPNELGDDTTFTLEKPILLDSVSLSLKTGYPTLSQLTNRFPYEQFDHLQTITLDGETTAQALERLAQTAIDSVRNGAKIILLDDSAAFPNQNGWVDPILALSVIDLALRKTFAELNSSESSSTPLPINDSGKIDLGLMASHSAVNLRRQVGLVVRSGAIRNLHDVIMCVGMGADAISPYLIFEAAVKATNDEEEIEGLKKTFKALRSGIEKCISTMGIHEARGYGRVFSSIGLSNPVASALGVWGRSTRAESKIAGKIPGRGKPRGPWGPRAFLSRSGRGHPSFLVFSSSPLLVFSSSPPNLRFRAPLRWPR